MGTEYFRSAAEYFVINEMITFLPSAEYSSALKAMTLIGLVLSLTHRNNLTKSTRPFSREILQMKPTLVE